MRSKSMRRTSAGEIAFSHFAANRIERRLHFFEIDLSRHITFPTRAASIRSVSLICQWDTFGRVTGTTVVAESLAERPSALLSLRSVGRSSAVIRASSTGVQRIPCAGCSFEIADNSEVSALHGCAATPRGSAPSNGVGVSEPFSRSPDRPMQNAPSSRPQRNPISMFRMIRPVNSTAAAIYPSKSSAMLSHSASSGSRQRDFSARPYQ
jgi:hypothetical protein